MTDNHSCDRCCISVQEKLYNAWCALDDVFTVYLQNKDLWRDKLDEAVDASAGSRILACNFYTPDLQDWWKYIYADIIEHYDTYGNPEAGRPIVFLVICTARLDPMRFLQSLLTAVGVGEAHSFCSIEQCLAELEASLVHRSGSSSSSKVILVLYQMHELAGLGDAGRMVLERLLQLTEPDNSRLILVGLTLESQAALPRSIQQLTQENDYVRTVKLTDEKAAQTEAIVQAAVGRILVPGISHIVRSWIALAGSWVPVAVEFCRDVVEIALDQSRGADAVVSEQQLSLAYSHWYKHNDLVAVRHHLRCFKDSYMTFAYVSLNNK